MRGHVLLIIATAAASSRVDLAGTIIGGSGLSIAFLGALRALTGVVPTEHRAAVVSAVYIVCAALSVPAIAAGVLVGPLGLMTTFEVFGSAVAALALIAALRASRTPSDAPAVSATRVPKRRSGAARTLGHPTSGVTGAMSSARRDSRRERRTRRVTSREEP